MRRGWTLVAAIMLLVAAGCGGSSDGLSSKAADVALARLGAQQSVTVTKALSCKKTSGGEKAVSYTCSGEVTTGASAEPQRVSVVVVCAADEDRCIP